MSEQLKPEGVYVGEVTIAGMIKGTPYDSGSAMEGTVVADAFWSLYQAREAVRVRVS